MVVLALETATRRGSMGLWRDGRSAGRPGLSTETHGQRLPGELIEWLGSEGLTLGEVDYLAVTSGPGSFTGLRVGMAAVQGLALPSGRPIVLVPTLEALAEAWLTGGEPVDGVVAPWMDGQRGDIFLAAYQGQALTTTADATLLTAPTVGPPASVIGALLRAADGAALTLVGDPEQRHAAALRELAPDARLVAPSFTLAEAAARLAARRAGDAVPPHGVGPVYVRRPDVVMARDRVREAADVAAAAAVDTDVVVRAAGPDDFAAVAALQGAAFTNPWSVDAIRWELDHTDVARLYVLVEAGAVLGYCACWIVFDELHINSLAVAEAQRRRGLARRLLAAVFRDAVAAGARSATLEVRESNEAARRLYEGLGFAVEGRRRDYYQRPREDALVLWNRNLQAHGAG